MMTNQPALKHLSIVIISYNVSAFLEKCLQSIYQADGGSEADIIVVDNHSVDDSVSMVKRKFPQVRLIENDKNLGFGMANNQAMRFINSKYVLLLNPDTLINEDTLMTCHAFMETTPEAAAVGVKMFDGSGKYLPESKRGFPSPVTAIFKMTGLSSLIPRSRLFNAYYLGHLDEDQTQKIDVLAGAFMYIRTEAMRKVGGFDEDFFMYGEDIDLSYRFVKAGYNNYYLPSTSIIHYKGESTRKSSLNYVRSFYRAMIIFLDKHYRDPGHRPFVWIIKAGIYLRAFLSGAGRILRQILPAAADASMLFLSVILAQYIWSNYYYHDPSYFDNRFFTTNLPLYTAVFILFLLISGAYDKYYSVRRLVAGLLTGTIAILVIYAMLNQAYRSSRAVILLSAAIGFITTLTLRFLVHKFRYKSFRLGFKPMKKAILIASRQEAVRIMELLNRSEARIILKAKLNPGRDYDPDFFDNNLSQLDDVLNVFSVDEIIFSAHDVSFQEITFWMNRLGNEYAFKIASAKSEQIVGSRSKQYAGELYTMDFEYRLARNFHRRNKRVFDIFSAVALILVSPVLVPFNHGSTRYFRHCFEILKGRSTWIGYHPADLNIRHLPKIKPGIFWPGPRHGGVENNQQVVRMKNMLYAKEYSIWKDAEMVLSHIREIGSEQVISDHHQPKRV